MAFGTLFVLALIDATSLGTLTLPLWMMLSPRIRPQAIVTYLLTIGAFYWVFGCILFFGAYAAFARISGWSGLIWIQLIAGAGLLLLGVLPTRIWDRQMTILNRFQQRAAMGSSLRPVIILALVAGVIEAASMVPYLAAIGIMITADLPGPLTLAVYCLIMITPALILLGLRLAAGRGLEAPLSWLQRTLTKHAGATAATVVFIIGLLLAGSALMELRIIG